MESKRRSDLAHPGLDDGWLVDGLVAIKGLDRWVEVVVVAGIASVGV